jgi:hypothetical protein
MTDAHLSLDWRTLTILVPMTFKTRGGRKLVILPDGVPSWAKYHTRVDNTMVKALARAFRWRKLMETGVYTTIEEIAAAEKINTSYVSRILRMTLLAPEIIEMIVDGRQPMELTLAKLTKPFPVDWNQQMLLFGIDGQIEVARNSSIELEISS